MMINKQKTNKAGLLKYLLVMPLVLALVLWNASGNLMVASQLNAKPSVVSVWKNNTHVNGKFLNDIPNDLKAIVKGRVVLPDNNVARNAEVLVMRGNTGYINHTDNEGYFNVQMIKGGMLTFYAVGQNGIHYVGSGRYYNDARNVEIVLHPTKNIKSTTKK